MKFILDPPNPLVSQENGEFILNSKNAFHCSLITFSLFFKRLDWFLFFIFFIYEDVVYVRIIHLMIFQGSYYNLSI